MDDVNVATDVMLCRECGRTASFAGLVHGGTVPLVVDQPAGCGVEERPGGFRVWATTRSLSALFYIPFTCFWSGFSLNGIYGGQLRAGRFNPFESLFGLMFVAGTVLLVTQCVMSVTGHMEVLVHGEEVVVFAGVGPLGWARRFLWSDFDLAREESSKGSKGQLRHSIVLEGSKRVSFGTMLSENRRYWMLHVLRQRLASRAVLGHGDWR